MRGLWRRLENNLRGRKDPAQRRPVVFIHIPKTAGTTTLEIFKRYYSPSFTSYDDHHRVSIADANSFQFVSGHFYYDYCKDILPNRFSFTFLRRPTERIVSLYYHNRRVKSDKYEIFRIARENSLENYLKICLSRDDLRSAVWNHQTLTLAGGPHLLAGKRLDELDRDALLARAKVNIMTLSYVGLVDTYEEDLSAICTALSIPEPRKVVKKNRTTDRPDFSELSISARELIADLARLDEDLYEFVNRERGLVMGPDQK